MAEPNDTPQDTPQAVDDPAGGSATPSVTAEQFSELAEQVSGLTDSFGKLQEGLSSSQIAEEDQAVLAALRSNPQLTEILTALGEAGKPKDEPNANLDIPEAVAREVERHLQEQASKKYQQDFAMATAQENKIIESVLKDKQFAKIMGDVSFDAAFKGEGSKAAQILAVLADHYTWTRGTQDANGNRMPLTDPSQLGSIIQDISEGLKELKAAAIMEASVEPESREEEGITQEVVDVVANDDTERLALDLSDEEWEKQKAKRNAAFQKYMNKVSKDGAPASQL